MDFLKTQIAWVQQQLAGLTASQRMLAGALVVIMLMTLYGWSIFAGRSEMESILEQPLSAEEMGNIRRFLGGRGVKYNVVGDRIMIPAEQKESLLADLAIEDLLPQDTRRAFQDIIDKSSIFMTNRDHDARWTEALSQEMVRVLRRFPNVRQASVFIERKREAGFNQVEPSAAVTLMTRDGKGKMDRRVARGAARLVAGGANLKLSRVDVIVDGVPYPIGADADAEAMGDAGDQWLYQTEQTERYYREEMRKFLHFIPGDVMVRVSVRPDLEKKEKVKRTVDPKNMVSAAVVEENTNETTAGAQKGGETGVVPNSGLSMTDPGSSESNNSSIEKTRVESKPDYGDEVVKSWTPGGMPELKGAAVLIPRSYFVAQFPKEQRQSGEPDEVLFRPFVDAEAKRLKAMVVRAFAPLTEDAVAVDMYMDAEPAIAATPLAAASPMVIAVGDHLREISLGALALLSLFMVSTFVKKTAPVSKNAPPPAPKPPVLSGREEAIGEVGEGGPALDGMELDEDAVKAQQILRQVEDMVDENPDAAAAMVKRWLSRS